MARKKVTTTDEAAVDHSEGETSKVVDAPAPAPKVGASSMRIRALSHIKRAAGHVEANQEFEPADEKERKFLLGIGAAEEL